MSDNLREQLVARLLENARTNPQWIDNISKQMEAVCKAHNLLGPYYFFPHGRGNFTFAAIHPEYKDVVVKLYQEPNDAKREAKGLLFFNQIKLVHIGEKELIMERIIDAHDLAQENEFGIPMTKRLLAQRQNFGQLHHKVDDDTMIPLDEFLAAHYQNRMFAKWEKLKSHELFEGLCPIWDTWVTVCKEGEQTILHGDLSPGNVLSEDGRYILIDPILFCGPPAYDYAKWLIHNQWRLLDQSTDLTAHIDLISSSGIDRRSLVLLAQLFAFDRALYFGFLDNMEKAQKWLRFLSYLALETEDGMINPLAQISDKSVT